MLVLVIAALLIAGAISFFYYSYNDGNSIELNWMDQTGVLPQSWIPYGLLVLVLFLVALWILSLIFSLPKRLRRSGETRNMRKSRESLDRGLMEIQTGEFERGESTLTSYIEGTPGDAVKYIAAAKSAQARGADAQAEHFLKKASDSSNAAGSAVRMTQAEMMLKQGNYRDAETLLINLHKANPKNAHIMGLLATAFEGTGNASKLAELTSLMRSKTKLPIESIEPLEVNAWKKIVADADSEKLIETWELLPGAARNENNVVGTYARRLMGEGEHEKAEFVLQKALSVDPKSSVLTHAMGQLSAKQQQWGKARESLVKSAQMNLTSETCKDLGDVLEAMGDNEHALDCFKSAAALATGGAPVGILQDTSSLANLLTAQAPRKVS